jgi:hypothetical protein
MLLFISLNNSESSVLIGWCTEGKKERLVPLLPRMYRRKERKIGASFTTNVPKERNKERKKMCCGLVFVADNELQVGFYFRAYAHLGTI